MREGDYTYEKGRRDTFTARTSLDWVLADAALDWRRAAFDHAETSYWGREHIRGMVGYWLGVLRTRRELEGTWTASSKRASETLRETRKLRVRVPA